MARDYVRPCLPTDTPRIANFLPKTKEHSNAFGCRRNRFSPVFILGVVEFAKLDATLNGYFPLLAPSSYSLGVWHPSSRENPRTINHPEIEKPAKTSRIGIAMHPFGLEALAGFTIIDPIQSIYSHNCRQYSKRMVICQWGK